MVFQGTNCRLLTTILLLLSSLHHSLRLSVSMSAPKLKILCLHGKQQNKEIFRTKLGRIPHKLKHMAELTVIDAPFILEELSTPEVSARTWFYRQPDTNEIHMESLKSSMEMLQQTWRESGPYDGIFGFSMGGTMAALMGGSVLPKCDGSDAAGGTAMFSELKFIICAGAVDVPTYLEAVIPTSNLPFLCPLSIPANIQSLHIAGKTDTSVPIESSLALSGRFKDAIFVEHEQGHHIPMKAAVLQAIVEFVSKQVGRAEVVTVDSLS